MDLLPETTQLRLLSVLVHFLWQGTVIALAAAGAMALFRSPHGRYAAALLGFLMLASAPLATWCWLSEPVRQEDVSIPVVEPDDAAMGRLPSDEAQPMSLPDFTAERVASPMQVERNVELPMANSPRATEFDGSRAAAQWALRGWVLGVCVLSFRLVLGAIAVWRWRWQSLPLSESLKVMLEELQQRWQLKLPAVRLSDRVRDAVALGLFKPMILVPVSWATQLPADMLEAVLAHELAHVRRFDLWVNVLQGIVETLLFYHPAVWWLSRRLRLERELCCDEWAANLTDDRLRYAEMLECVARLSLGNSTSSLSLAVSGRGGELLRRVKQVLQPVPQRSGRSAWIGGLLAVGCLLLIGVSVGSQETIVALDADPVEISETDNALVDAAKDEQDAAVEAAPVLVDLPGGRSFELVGITKNTALAKNGWKPNGTPIGDVGEWRSTIVLHDKNSSSAFTEGGSHPEPDPDALDVLVRFRGLKEQPSLTFDMATNGSSYHQLPLKDPYEIRVSTRRRGEPSPGAKWGVPDGEVRIGLTDEPWGKWVQVSSEGEVLNPSQTGERYHRHYDAIRVHDVVDQRQAPNKKALVVCQPIDSPSLYVFEMRGIGEDDKPQWVIEHESGVKREAELRYGHWGLGSAEKQPLKRYEFRLRPYRHWVTVTGVQFEPGKPSRVETSVKTIPDPDRTADAQAPTRSQALPGDASPEAPPHVPESETGSASGDGATKTKLEAEPRGARPQAEPGNEKVKLERPDPKTLPTLDEFEKFEPKNARKTSLTLAQIKDRLQAEEAKYTRFELTFETHQRPDSKKLNGFGRTRFVRDGVRSYYFKQHDGTDHRSIVEEVVLDRWKLHRSEWPTRPAQKVQTYVSALPNNQHPLSAHQLMRSLSGLVPNDFEVVGEERVGDEWCVKLASKNEPVGGNQIWLALNKNLIPARYEIRGTQQSKPFTTFVVVDWTELKAGVWLPKRQLGLHHWLRADGVTFQTEIGPTLVVTQATLDPVIDAKLFEKLGQPPKQEPPQTVAMQSIEVRLLGEKQQPLNDVQVEITEGHGADQKKFGPFMTDAEGTLRCTLPRGSFYFHLKSDRELPYLPVDVAWDKSPRGPTPNLVLWMQANGPMKFAKDKERPESVEPAKDGSLPRVTYTLLRATELTLRAIDAETGKGLPGVEFYEENAVGEDWAHDIEGHNIGSQRRSSKRTENSTLQTSGLVTDTDGNFKRLVGANDGFKYGVAKSPVGYALVEPQAEVEVPIVFGQARAERVFKFTRFTRSQALPGNASPEAPPHVPVAATGSTSGDAAKGTKTEAEPRGARPQAKPGDEKVDFDVKAVRQELEEKTRDLQKAIADLTKTRDAKGDTSRLDRDVAMARVRVASLQLKLVEAGHRVQPGADSDAVLQKLKRETLVRWGTSRDGVQIGLERVALKDSFTVGEPIKFQHRVRNTKADEQRITLRFAAANKVVSVLHPANRLVVNALAPVTESFSVTLASGADAVIEGAQFQIDTKGMIPDRFHVESYQRFVLNESKVASEQIDVRPPGWTEIPRDLDLNFNVVAARSQAEPGNEKPFDLQGGADIFWGSPLQGLQLGLRYTRPLTHPNHLQHSENWMWKIDETVKAELLVRNVTATASPVTYRVTEDDKLLELDPYAGSVSPYDNYGPIQPRFNKTRVARDGYEPTNRERTKVLEPGEMLVIATQEFQLLKRPAPNDEEWKKLPRVNLVLVEPDGLYRLVTNLSVRGSMVSAISLQTGKARLWMRDAYPQPEAVQPVGIAGDAVPGQGRVTLRYKIPKAAPQATFVIRPIDPMAGTQRRTVRNDGLAESVPLNAGRYEVAREITLKVGDQKTVVECQRQRFDIEVGKDTAINFLRDADNLVSAKGVWKSLREHSMRGAFLTVHPLGKDHMNANDPDSYIDFEAVRETLAATTCGPDGTFEIEPLPAGRYVMILRGFRDSPNDPQRVVLPYIVGAETFNIYPHSDRALFYPNDFRLHPRWTLQK